MKGDATQPVGEGPKIIAHICNDTGEWGRGFVITVSKRWPATLQRYRAWHRAEEKEPFALGAVQFVQVSDGLWVANLIGQHDERPIDGIPPIRYEALRTGLQKVAVEAGRLGASIHMPRIGCGLAGGTWEQVSSIIEDDLTRKDIPVTVYDFI